MLLKGVCSFHRLPRLPRRPNIPSLALRGMAPFGNVPLTVFHLALDNFAWDLQFLSSVEFSLSKGMQYDGVVGDKG